MKPHELLQHLAEATGLATLELATQIHKPTFQGTLYRLMLGESKAPKRETAKRIAAYFEIPIDALYEDSIATEVAAARGFIKRTASPIPYPSTALKADEPPPQHSLVVKGIKSRVLSRNLLDRIAKLDAKQFKTLEGVIETYLDAVTPKTTESGKALQA